MYVVCALNWCNVVCTVVVCALDWCHVVYIVCASGWCHVVCALYIPEAWFGSVQSMEPIILKGVPQERYNKVRFQFLFTENICL